MRECIRKSRACKYFLGSAARAAAHAGAGIGQTAYTGTAITITTLALAASLARTAAAAPARQEESGEAFPNGINVTRYVGADGSYAKYKSEGIRLGLIEAFPVNFTDPETGERTGWNTDIVLRALEHSGIDKYEFVDGPWE